MIKKSVLMLLALMIAAGIGCGGKGKTLVSINGTSITEGDLDFLATMNPRLKMQLSTPFGKKQILDNMVEQELLYQAAIKKGIQRDPSAKAKIELYKKVIIAQSLVENEMKAAAKEYYDKNKSEFEKLQLSDIFIKYAADKKDEKAGKGKKAAPATKERSKDAALKLANEIKARLDKGEEFATVAKEVSDDPMSKANGGDMGKVARNDPRFERKGWQPVVDKAYTMQVGEIAGPIETSDGYHIITVTKGAELEPFEDVEQSILMKISGEERNKLLAELKKNAKIVYPGEEKKPAETKPAEAKPSEGQPAETEKPKQEEKVKGAPESQPHEHGKAPAEKKLQLKLPAVEKSEKKN